MGREKDSRIDQKAQKRPTDRGKRDPQIKHPDLERPETKKQMCIAEKAKRKERSKRLHIQRLVK